MDGAALVAEHRAQMVIASVGSPAPIMETIHEYGGLVFSHIASMRHAEKAIATGVDGLIPLMAGARGQTGWANPFAFVRAVRAIFDGPVVLAGGVSDGVALKAAVTLGCDLAYMGTRFIATRKAWRFRGTRICSRPRRWTIDMTSAFTGLPASKLSPSIVAAELDPDAAGARDDRHYKDVIRTNGPNVGKILGPPDIPYRA